VLAGFVILMVQARPSTTKTVEAERFVVKDSSGKIRAMFGMEEGDPDGATLAFKGLPSFSDTKMCPLRKSLIVHRHLKQFEFSASMSWPVSPRFPSAYDRELSPNLPRLTAPIQYTEAPATSRRQARRSRMDARSI
jgi:hypothetical protein